jgi:hypothetical protein
MRNVRIAINHNFIQCEETTEGFSIFAGERESYVQLSFNKRWEPTFYNIIGVPLPIAKYCYATSPNFQQYLEKIEEYVLEKYNIIKSDAQTLLK